MDKDRDELLDFMTGHEEDDDDTENFLSNDPDDDDDDEDPSSDSDDDSDVDDDDESDVDEDDDDDDDDDDLGKKFPEDKEGNLVDEDGKVVARKGKERSVFEKLKRNYNKAQTDNKKLASTLTNLANETKLLMGKYKELQETKSYPEKLGLDDKEIREAAELYAQMKVDAKGALKKILTKLHLGGTDLSSIGVTDSVDAETVARHVYELQKKDKEKSATDSVEDPNLVEAQAFLERHPDAVNYTDLIGEARQKYPHMTFDQIWFEIKSRAKRGKKTTAKANGKAGKPTMPSSRGNKVTRKTHRKGLDLTPVDPNTPFEKISRDLLRDLKALEE